MPLWFHFRLNVNLLELICRLYMTTKLLEPNYSAEVSAKVSILNFAITTDGLHEYLLGVTVARERPDVEAEKNQLILQQVDTNRTLRDEEQKTIDTLAADSNILDDDAAVQSISMSKMMMNELIEKLAVARVTEKQIDACRMTYASLAEHAAVLYFTIGRIALENIQNIGKLFLKLNFIVLSLIFSWYDEAESDVSVQLGVVYWSFHSRNR